jgi:hypothetical protein
MKRGKHLGLSELATFVGRENGKSEGLRIECFTGKGFDDKVSSVGIHGRDQHPCGRF